MKLKAKTSVELHNPIIHGGLLSKTSLSGILDFSSNVSPVGMPLQIQKSIKNHLSKIEVYPDVNSNHLLKSLKNYTKLSESNLIVGNGAIEIIYNFCNAFLSRNSPVLIPIPTFGEYEAASKINGSKISFFKTMNLNEDLDSFISKLPKNGCTFICNPNNPTGKLISRKNLLRIVKEAKKRNCIVFVDECFIELVPHSNESIISSVKKYDNLLVLRSLTKSFGLAGIRVGYAASSKYIISILKKIKIPWSVNSIAEYLAVDILKNSSHLKKSKSVIRKESDFLKNKIANIDGFDTIDSSTNFILIRTKQNSTILQKKLLEKKILVRDCKNFRGLDNHYIRIAIKSHKDNLVLVNALEKIK